MSNFTYKEPYLYKDKDNKKWCIRYAIKYPGESDFTHYKDYGKQFWESSLNRIEDLKEREDKFRVLTQAVKRQLEKGVDIHNKTTVKNHVEEKIKVVKEAEYRANTKYTFDYNYQFYLKHKGYDKPAPKQELSAQTLKMFLTNQFRLFLEKNKLLSDVRNITKSHLLDFMNGYYLNSDPELKWSNNTYNNKRSYLSSFFGLLVDEDVLSVNPVENVKRKKKEKTERFGVYSKEERDLLFEYLETHYNTVSVIAKIIYYSYIRSSELSRLTVAAFDLVNRRITIDSEEAKTQHDNMERKILMLKPLQAAITEYLDKHPNKPNWYIFGKDKKPSMYRIGKGWQKQFDEALKALRKEHPKLFNADNLNIYGLKHSGVTHFIQDNKDKFTTLELLQFVQQQCRHENFTETQKYWRQLGFSLESADKFMDL